MLKSTTKKKKEEEEERKKAHQIYSNDELCIYFYLLGG